ncbi:MAG TPA: hypothetical protein VML55_19040 [Planctomycetaceae bacterium]|nr:hypothetical protein [Planctomycetaceae bacterium]
MSPHQAYAIDVWGERSELDLDFDGRRYLLIISSLAAADDEYPITLTSRPADRVRRLPARPLPPWPGGRTGGTSASNRQTSIRAAEEPTASDGEPETWARLDPALAHERDFHLHVSEGRLDDPRHYARVRGRAVAEGRHVRVYLDTRFKPGALAPGLVADIVRRFEGEINPLAERWLGRSLDVDGDGRFAILLTGWLGRLEGGRTSLGGFVRAADFRRDLPAPFSNRCDMMYLNADLRPGPHLGALLAHEFAHAVCFSERTAAGGGGGGDAFPDEEDWLNEAIAHVTENLYGASWSNLDYRISRYLSDPARYPLVVPDYYGAGRWRDHGCRGATFLLLRWCVDQFGEDLLRRLVRGRRPGIRNLESATGLRFDELYRRWTLALAGVSPDASGAYRSIDLYGQLSGWGLCGPRTEAWDVAGDQRLLVLTGTATAFVELHASAPGIHSVRVQAPPRAGLQLTLVPLPSDLSRLELQAEWIPPGNSTGLGGVHRSEPSTIRIRAIGSNPDVRIEWLACEQNDGESRASVCWSAEDLERLEPAAPGSGDRHPLEDVQSVTLELPLPSRMTNGASLMLKVSGRDGRGRTVVAWATVPKPETGVRRPVRLAVRDRHAPPTSSPHRNLPENR